MVSIHLNLPKTMRLYPYLDLVSAAMYKYEIFSSSKFSQLFSSFHLISLIIQCKVVLEPCSQAGR